MKIKNYSAGQSLFEVVVAIAISALIIVALVSLASTSIRNATFSRNKNLAAGLAQSGNEWLRSQRDTDAANFFVKVQTTVWCMNTLSFDPGNVGECSNTIPGSPFSREVTFTDKTTVGGKTLIQADVIVFWTDSQGYHEVVSATDFTDWRQR